MEKIIKCKIIEDLLPNYIEKLTCKDTNDIIIEHLTSCKHCQKIYKNMTADIFDGGNNVKQR